jgi:hypothetical protein
MFAGAWPMRLGAITVLVTGAIIAGSIVPNRVEAQGSPASPAVQRFEVSPIGKVAKATGAVTIEHVDAVVLQANLGGQPGHVKVGDPVYRGDTITTGTDGQAGIVFADGTAFNVSTNARIVLNEFVYDPNGKSNSSLFSLSKGALTLVAGKIAKTGNMKVDTPLATMGIRGTTPHIEISDNGTVKFSTLIEEGTGGTGNNTKRAQRQGKAPPSPGSQQRPVQRAYPNFNICRGC